MSRAIEGVNNQQVGLNKPQFKALRSNAKITCLVAGLGLGKSFAIGCFSYANARYRKSFGLIAAGTKEQLRDSTMPKVQEAWQRLGLEEGRHYVIGVRPPKRWNVEPWDAQNNRNIITFRWGAYAKLGSMERYHTHRGPEYDWIAGDEFRDWKDGVLTVVVPRLRGVAFKEIGRKSRLFLGTTPPDDPQKIKKLLKRRSVEVIYGTTFDNLRNLPDDYIETQRDILDELTFRREILGELIDVSGAFVYSSFTEASLVSPRPFDPQAETWLAWDFNIGKKPMVCLVIQADRHHADRYVVVKEFVFKQSNTTRTAEAVRDWLIEHGADTAHTPIEVTGDYAGTRRESNATRTDYDIILEHLKEFTGHRRGRAVRTRYRPTYRIRDRVATTNALFCNYNRRRRLFIARDCEKLIEDLDLTKFNDDGRTLDDSDDDRTHPSDALSYFPYNYFPFEQIFSD